MEMIVYPLFLSLVLYIILNECSGIKRSDAISYSSILFAVITWFVQTLHTNSIKREVSRAKCEVHAFYGREICEIIIHYCVKCHYDKLPNQLARIKGTLVHISKNCAHDNILKDKIQKHKKGVLGFIRQASVNKIDNNQSNLELRELFELIHNISVDFDNL